MGYYKRARIRDIWYDLPQTVVSGADSGASRRLGAPAGGTLVDNEKITNDVFPSIPPGDVLDFDQNTWIPTEEVIGNTIFRNATDDPLVFSDNALRGVPFKSWFGSARFPPPETLSEYNYFTNGKENPPNTLTYAQAADPSPPISFELPIAQEINQLRAYFSMPNIIDNSFLYPDASKQPYHPVDRPNGYKIRCQFKWRLFDANKNLLGEVNGVNAPGEYGRSQVFIQRFAAVQNVKFIQFHRQRFLNGLVELEAYPKVDLYAGVKPLLLNPPKEWDLNVTTTGPFPAPNNILSTASVEYIEDGNIFNISPVYGNKSNGGLPITNVLNDDPLSRVNHSNIPRPFFFTFSSPTNITDFGLLSQDSGVKCTAMFYDDQLRLIHETNGSNSPVVGAGTYCKTFLLTANGQPFNIGPVSYILLKFPDDGCKSLYCVYAY